ncbi:MAG: GldG family protein [Deltaproteobacteria bacterium]|nr:GldG family protein [Deltaproteobacteria bacterium]
MRFRRGLDSALWLGSMLGSLLLLNVLGSMVFARADLTRTGEFTLSEATRHVLDGASRPVTVRAYFSEGLPGKLGAMARQVRDLLDAYYAEGNGFFRFEFIDPVSLETDEDRQKKQEIRRDPFGNVVRDKTSVENMLEGEGIRAVTVRVNEADKIEDKRVFLGVTVSAGESKEVIPMVRSAVGFEYELTTRIRKVLQPEPATVGIVTGFGGPTLDEDVRLFRGEMEKLFKVLPVDLSAAAARVPDSVQALLLIGPDKPLSDDALRAIDAFLMAGGKLGFFVSPISPDWSNLKVVSAKHGLGGLLASYGLALPEALVMDADMMSIPITERRGAMQVTRNVKYPFFLVPKDLDQKHPVTRGMADLVFPFMGPVEFVGVSGVEMDVGILVRSSPRAGLNMPPFQTNPLQGWTQDQLSDPGTKNLAMTLSGAIPSHFDQKRRADKGRLVVVGGHGFLLDQFIRQAPVNLAFALNLVDWMLLDQALVGIRNRGLDPAPLDELSSARRLAVKYMNIFGVPLLFVGLGLIRWRFRQARRKRVRLDG